MSMMIYEGILRSQKMREFYIAISSALKTLPVNSVKYHLFRLVHDWDQEKLIKKILKISSR